MQQATVGDYLLLQLGISGVGMIYLAKKNQNTNECSICKGIIINGENRKEICKTLEALAAKAGLSYKTIIENRLCKANITNLKLAELAGNLQTLSTANLQRILTDINETAQLQNNLNGITKPLLTTWQYLFEKHTTRAEFARKDWNTLQQFGKLNDNVKAEIVQLTDNSTTDSRIKQFCNDMSNTTGFTAFLNDVDNFDIVSNGFLGYRTTKNKDEAFIADMRQEQKPYFDATLWQTIDKWLKHSFDVIKRNRSFEDGTKFEAAMKTDLANPNSAAFKGLEAYVTDLKDRTILYQVYFCIPEGKQPPCTDKGSFFIADFACVKPAYDALGNVNGYDVVIVDSKLSSGSDFTANQTTAKGMTGYYLRTPTKTIKDDPFEDKPYFEVGKFIGRAKDGTTNSKLPFYKIISNGNLGYGSVIPKN
jgi:hypothetical protein